MTTNIQDYIRSKSAELYEKVNAYREYLHANPELSFEEYETAKFVSSKLDLLGIKTERIGNTGVVGLIMGDHHSLSDSFIGLRADLDALPIIENNEIPYKSKIPGKMHACGHDVHTSILLGAAEILVAIRNDLKYPIKLIFQPGEEKNPGGASILISEGVLQNPKVTKMFALHVFPEMEVGNIGFKEGLYMASCDEIYITIHGKGGHGAIPHQCIDPILIGANLLTSLQQIVSRSCDPKIPCVLSFGHFEGIGATNIIPSKVYLKGTFRTMDEECLINDVNLTEKFKSTCEDFFGKQYIHDLPLRLTSEDFAFYSQQIPVCFVRLGVGNESKGINFGVHHPNFDIDSKALIPGIQTMCLAAFN